MNQAICNVCGAVVGWEPEKGKKLEELTHADVVTYQEARKKVIGCRGTLRPYQEEPPLEKIPIPAYINWTYVKGYRDAFMGLEESWPGGDVAIYLQGYDAGLLHRGKEAHKRPYDGGKG